MFDVQSDSTVVKLQNDVIIYISHDISTLGLQPGSLLAISLARSGLSLENVVLTQVQVSTPTGHSPEAEQNSRVALVELRTTSARFSLKHCSRKCCMCSALQETSDSPL